MAVLGWISGVKFRSTTVGTGTIFSAGPVSAAWRTPTAAENGVKLSYEILNINAPTQRENGRGFWNQAAQSLSRPGGADLIFPATLVNFSAGAELHVSIVPLGEDFVEGHWKDGGGLIPGAIDMSTRAKYDRLTIASPITWGMSSSTPAPFGGAQAWLNVVGATRAQTWPARFMSAEPLVPLPASLPVGTYLLLMEWSPDADPTDVGGVGDPHRILTKVHGFSATGDEATFNPSLVDLSRSGTFQYNALTQTGALAFALDPAKTPIIGSMVLVPILGNGGATTWSADFVGAGGLPTFLESGETHWVAIAWEKDAIQITPGVFADKALVVLPGQAIGGDVSSTRQIATQHSITGGGDLSADRTLNLVGDSASPGNTKYYGTNGVGTRGFYDIPSGSGHIIQEEGSALTTRAALNFIGSNVTATDDVGNNRTNITIVDATEAIIIAASDETTALTTGGTKVTFRMPYALTLTNVRASVSVAPTGSTLIVDINEGGATILSTKLSIDAGEKTSTTAASTAVISDTALANDAEITIDIDQVGSTIAGAGLKVYLIGTR